MTSSAALQNGLKQLVKQVKLEPPAYNLHLVRLSSCLASDPHRVRFVLRAGDALLAGDQTYLVTNYPLNGSAFGRDDFHAKQFVYDYVNDAIVDIELSMPGAYEYYVAHRQNDGVNHKVQTQTDLLTRATSSGCIIVEPQLYTKRVQALGMAIGIASKSADQNDDKVLLPLDGVALQTFTPKWLGPLSSWDPHFRVCQKLGFNMVHFVPLQQRGASGSPYSLYDQLSFSDDLFVTDDGNGVNTIPLDNKEKEQLIQRQLSKMETEFGLLSMTDVVWNHTAHNCEWLRHHPEAGYNLVNSPHLRPAFELDEGLLQFSRALQTEHGINLNICSEADLNQIASAFRNKVLPDLRLWEYFTINVKGSINALQELLTSTSQDDNWPLPEADNDSPFSDQIDMLYKLDLTARSVELTKYLIESTGDGERFPCHIPLPIALNFVLMWYYGHKKHGSTLGDNDEPAISVLCREYQRILDEINLLYYKKYDAYVDTITTNLIQNVRWQRVDVMGPKLGPVSEQDPLVSSYFTRITLLPGSSHSNDALVVANNGWIWNANPMIDFASAGSQAYFRREVIVWGDCIKLRYGQSREDSPWLWDHMAQYTRLMAKLFHGFRIDNCHSTPIHLAQYLLDIARQERPNLYVIAELFTGNEHTDRIFVSKLGINSLIREAMQAWDTKELSRLVHRYSGDPVGSFSQSGHASMLCMTAPHQVLDLKCSDSHAIFMDCTHDNETPAQKRTSVDALSNAATVSMACCAMGSVRGYDELVPHYLDIVKENRLYKKVDEHTGIGPARTVLNHCHSAMAAQGYTEIYVHQEDQFIVIHRQHPTTHRGYMLITRTAFSKSAPAQALLTPVVLRKTRVQFLHSFSLETEDVEQFVRDPREINGLRVKHLAIAQSQDRTKYALQTNGNKVMNNAIINHPFFAITEEQQDTVVSVSSNIPPGSIILLETWLNSTDMLGPLHELECMEGTLASGIKEACSPLTLDDVNVVLYRVDSEERDATGGHGAYVIPDYGQTSYCGLEGFAAILKQVMKTNDLGHPICQNLRNGPWIMDYICARLERQVDQCPNVLPLVKWLTTHFELVKTVPNYLTPKYFSVVLMSAYNAVRNRTFDQMSKFIREGSSFVRNLALTSTQMHGFVQTAGLHPTQPGPSLAAGLPHFATGYMRCWGRDVFLSLPGLLLVTGRHDEAKQHIVWGASTLRHGLIPNLLDSGRRPRYNARDATWFFLHAVQEYTRHVTNGLAILDVKVPRRFPLTDEYVELDDPRAYAVTCTVVDVIQEIMQRHASGIHFREWNAGSNLDHAMQDAGFQLDIEVDWTTGFVRGGNIHNCGTWMDKMGDSVKAGNMGIPATPRDGADVEIIGLLKSTLRWLTQLRQNKQYSWDGVDISGVDGSTKISFADWNNLVQSNFEKHFYIPLQVSEDSDYMIDDKFVNRRGMYKDTVGSSQKYTDYQLRPNQYIAMTVAPELFEPTHALAAIRLGKEVLHGPLGMRTLDPKDWAYRGHYDNSDDGADRLTAHGWNYHQGPEWVWVSGYFFRSFLHFESKYGYENEQLTLQVQVQRTLHQLNAILAPHKQHIAGALYAGLPELTNMDGEPCWHGCPTQAWSSVTPPKTSPNTRSISTSTKVQTSITKTRRVQPPRSVKKPRPDIVAVWQTGDHKASAGKLFETEIAAMSPEYVKGYSANDVCDMETSVGKGCVNYTQLPERPSTCNLFTATAPTVLNGDGVRDMELSSQQRPKHSLTANANKYERPSVSKLFGNTTRLPLQSIFNISKPVNNSTNQHSVLHPSDITTSQPFVPFFSRQPSIFEHNSVHDHPTSCHSSSHDTITRHVTQQQQQHNTYIQQSQQVVSSIFI